MKRKSITVNIFHDPSPNFTAREGVTSKDFTDVGKVNFEFRMDDEIGSTDILEHAFEKSQNIDESWNEDVPCRSSSVGDIFTFKDLGGYHHEYMIMPVGFRKLN